MHRIDGAGATVDNRFTEGNEASAIPATAVTADIANAFQEEIVSVVLAAGLTLNKADNTQLLTAIRALILLANPIGIILKWGGSIASIPTNYHLCDGTAGTPNLRDKFVVGAGTAYTVGATGGATSSVSTLSGAHTPTMLAAGVHAHTAALGGVHAHTTDVQGAHNHSLTIDPTTLTIAQIPAHDHGATPQNVGDTDRGTNSSLFSIDGQVTTSTGGSGPHTHGGSTVTAGSHSHTTTTDTGHTHATDAQGSHVHTINAVGDHAHAVATLPPYYALAYIMKIA